MIDLKEYAFFTLTEGILDDIEDQIVSGDDSMHADMLASWSKKGNEYAKAWWRKTKKGYVIKGNFKLNDIDEEYTGPKFKEVIGNIAICGSNLTSLEGIFTPDCIVNGTLTIEDNPKLTSLKGCPLQVNCLTISGNKSLKNIDLSPVVLNNAYVFKNGKKFKKEDLEKTLHVSKNIFCSVEDDAELVESNIMEAFKAPQLRLIVDAIKKVNTKDKEYQADLSGIRSIKWDKIDSSDIYEYDVKDPEGLKMCRRVLSDQDFIGIIVMLNKVGEVLGVCTGKSGILKLHRSLRSSWDDLNKYNMSHRYQTRTTTQLLDYIKNWSDTIMIINITDSSEGYGGHPEGKYSTRSLKDNRINNKRDAIAYDRQIEKEYSTNELQDGKLVRYYNNVAKQNRERYVRILKEIRAKRELEGNNRFNEINQKIEAAFDRYLKLIRKFAINPTLLSKDYNIKYEFDSLSAQLGAESRYSTPESSMGLMSLLKEYLKKLSEKDKYVGDNRSNFEKEYYDPKKYTEQLRRLEDYMQKRLVDVEQKLTMLERL